MKILAIETSCDETAVAVIEASGDFHADFRYSILGNALLSQASLHAQYGGVFPNLAKREHGRNLVPLLMEALKRADMLVGGKSDEAIITNLEPLLSREKELYGFVAEFLRTHSKPDIDCIAVTHGPGLEPALWVGINFAKALSQAWGLSIVAVNHMEGHIAIAALPGNGEISNFQFPISKKIQFPALALLVSGGHTELVLMKEWLKYHIVGETRDDAAGEAFDKCARILGLPYPGGPEISRLALEARSSKLEARVRFPRPMQTQDNLDFSFSGLKTAVKKHVGHTSQLAPEIIADIARATEDAIVDVLVSKTYRAVGEFSARTLIVSGGVSANQHLRSELERKIPEVLPLGSILFPTPEFATDNAVMIALAGYLHAQKGEFINPETLRAEGNLRLAE
ncbi:tRNA (adenosine(37)-N6)-threonylcarbamoyltransferase complex transferase subunit TsaD [Candidatus Kaiserbacteria bacterium]|nr:tRNA (adenosine(37)-N6)-threonylcarbamoyltransferase complex transferase subunit TsaD [Candidatus Kaiserbacteria bacterium]